MQLISLLFSNLSLPSHTIFSIATQGEFFPPSFSLFKIKMICDYLWLIYFQCVCLDVHVYLGIFPFSIRFTIVCLYVASRMLMSWSLPKGCSSLFTMSRFESPIVILLCTSLEAPGLSLCYFFYSPNISL